MERAQSAAGPATLQLSSLGQAHEKMKFKRGRSDAAKEIERWAHIGGDHPKTGAMRNTGQLSFNVTEQRLLETKVLELSRARYRFKSQNQYDKYMFLERQRRKSSVFRDLFADMTTDGQRSARPGPADLLQKGGGPRSLQSQISRRSAAGRSSIHNTHSTEQILPDRSLAPRVSLSRISAPAQDTSTVIDRNNKPVVRDVLPRSRSVVDDSRDTHMQLLPPVGKQRSTTFATERRDSDRKSNSDDGSATDGQLVPQRRLAYSLRKRDSRAPLADARYTRLEGALSLNYVSQVTTEIPTLVRRVDSLHVPPTIQMPKSKSKSKLSVKLFQLVAGMPLAF